MVKGKTMSKDDVIDISLMAVGAIIFGFGIYILFNWLVPNQNIPQEFYYDFINIIGITNSPFFIFVIGIVFAWIGYYLITRSQ